MATREARKRGEMLAARPAPKRSDELIATIYEAAMLSERWDGLPMDIARALGAESGLLHPCEIAPSGPECPVHVTLAISSPGADRWVLRLGRFADPDHAAEARHVLEMLRPHLARAVALFEQQALHDSRLTVAALDRIGAGAAILDDSGRVLAANARFAEQLGFASAAPGMPVRLSQRRDLASLRAGLAAAIGGGQRGAVPVHDEAGSCVAALHLLPVADTVQRGRLAPVLVLVATPRTDALPSPVLLQSLFGLTRAEASISRAVAAGDPLEAIAQAGGITSETARSHLKHVFSKTGTARQLELALMIRGFGLPAAASEARLARTELVH